VFQRDMVLPINFMADWGAIEQQRQKEMARNNRRENASRISHDYKVGEKVLLKKPGTHLRKLEAPRTTRPHTVTAIYTNGTLRIQKGKVNERVKIRRLFPYFENADH
jgi:lipopolysaccharide biosynthesis regulator YciM